MDKKKQKRKRQIIRRMLFFETCIISVLILLLNDGMNKNSLSYNSNEANCESMTIEPSGEKDTEEKDTEEVDSGKINTVVDRSYFEDAVFIGDSRTEGMVLYTGICDGYAIASKGLNVKSVFDDKCIKDGNNYVTAIDAIRNSSFNKAYIMFGINETGWQYSNVFIDYYREIIEEIKACNPAATIYVQSVLPVTKDVSDTSEYVKKNKIDEYNVLLQELAEEENVIYLNINNYIADTNGYLPETASLDGIHLNKEYCNKWLDYLCQHTNG